MTQPSAATIEAETTDVAPPPIVLRTALAPADGPQPYRIALQVESNLHQESVSLMSEKFEFECSGVLMRARESPAREVALTMTLQRVRGRIDRADSPGQIRSLAFDSENLGEPNALDRLLSPLVNARLRLLVTPSGQLRQLRGISELLRDRRLGAPPETACLRMFLNDAAFEMLVSSMLFPSLPSSPMAPEDRWEIRTGGCPLDPYPTISQLKGHLVSFDQDEHGYPVITLEAKGPILPDTATPRSKLVRGEQTLRQTVDWNDHSLRQRMDRRLEFISDSEGQTQPPESTPRYTRTATLISTRAGAAAQSRPE